MNWRVQVLGGLQLSQGSHVITHFESSRAAVLLARLALSAHRSQAREELLEMLWPDIDPDLSRARLRQTLYTLRRQLEPPGTPQGSVLIADRHAVRLNPGAFTCDALDFERLAREGRIEEARLAYAGDLMPGYYDEWLLDERDRLTALYESLPFAPRPVAPAIHPAPFMPPDNTRAESMPSASPLTLLSLPNYLTAFVGRDEAREQLVARLQAQRLVTLTGPGGVGKTRLAVQSARALATSGTFDIAAFVSLDDIVTPAQIPERVRAALGLPAGGANALDQLAGALAGRRTLLILDNFEQLVHAGGGGIVTDLLARLPLLTCLVTSRRLLGLEGEQEMPVAPFAPPPDAASLGETARDPNIALFVDRAQAARAGFALTAGNRDVLVGLCRALEGVPLALELAASRIRVMTPSEMQAQIQARLEWLARHSPGADKAPRQRSLRAALEWSWRLLTPTQAGFLASLSVFRGGWTADMAAQVCGFADARERLESLVMDSLIASSDTACSTTRFTMLESVREFARLHLSPEENETLIARHQAAFVAFAQRSGGSDAMLQAEAGNLLAALEAALETNNAPTAFALCLAADEGWMTLAGASGALDLVCHALRLPGIEPAQRLRAYNLAAYLAITAGESAQAYALASEALNMADAPNGERAVALVTRAKAGLMRGESLEVIGAWLAEALPLARDAKDARVEASCLRLTGIRAMRLGQFADAEACFAQALAISDMAGDRQGMVYALARQAVAAMQQGHLDRALILNQQCQERARQIGDMVYEAEMYQNLASIYAAQNRWQDSLHTGRECLRHNRLLGNTYILALTLWNMADVLSRLERHEPAIRLLAFAARFWTEHYSPLDESDAAYCTAIRYRAIHALNEMRTAALWQAGESLTLFEALELALAPDTASKT